MLKNIAISILKLCPNRLHFGTPKDASGQIYNVLSSKSRRFRKKPSFYQANRTFLGNLGSRFGLPSDPLLSYILCANMTQVGGSDFSSQIDFLWFWDVHLGTSLGGFLGGFQNRFCIFSSVLSRQNAYFFWKSVSERGSKLRPSWDPQNKLSYKNYHFSREVLRKRRFHWKINPNAEILKVSSRKLI